MSEIQQNIVSLIDFLGLTQGVLFGIILAVGSKRSRPSLFLGLFLMTFSFELLNLILEETLLIDQYPQLIFLPTDFYYLSPALLFLYAKSLILELERKDYLFLILGFIELLVFIVLFSLPSNTKVQLLDSVSFEIFSIIHILLFLMIMFFFVIKTIRLIHSHQSNIKNYYSSIHDKQLNWVKYGAYFLLFFMTLSLLSGIVIHTNSYFEVLLFTISNVVFIYWASVIGLRQPKINVPLLNDNIYQKKETILSSIAPNTSIQIEKIDEVEHDYQRLLTFMNTHKPFNNPELTIADLAEYCHTSTKKLSHLINQKAEVNFNTFVNQFRIEEAKKMLIDPTYNHLNVMGIGYEVGFNSKASFYAVFKKLSDTTPAKFKKSQYA